MSIDKNLHPDPVLEMKTAMTEQEALENRLSELMDQLHELGLVKAKEVMAKVLPSIPFPDGAQSTSAIPHTRDNLRIDFGASGDESLAVDKVDSETGISFLGMKVAGPIAGVIFQIRIPLAQLSATGVDKV